MVKKETREGALIAGLYFCIGIVAITESNIFAAAGWGAAGGTVVGYTYLIETGGDSFEEYSSDGSGS